MTSPASSRKRLTVALAGNPNAGKTSLFNQLTGARAHVGNYPGVTVEKREGTVRFQDRDIHVVDLPGTYSLTPYSLEERVAREFILTEKPDLVIDVVDATNLERNLYLTTQFLEIGVPVVVALNMVDMIEARGLRIDSAKLGGLLGARVVPTVARLGRGMDDLLAAVVATADEVPNEAPWAPVRMRYGPDLDPLVTEIAGWLERTDLPNPKRPSRWMALKLLEGDPQVRDLLADRPELLAKVNQTVDQVTRHLRSTLDDGPDGVIADHRYGFITSVTKQAVTVFQDLRRTISDKVDMLALNRLVGPILLLVVLYGIYQFVFITSETPVAWLEAFFGWLSGTVQSQMADGPLRSLLTSGIIDGVGGVLGFVPLIAFMFFAIALLEDSGYMARMAFIMDRVLRTFGLHGNSMLALMIGGGLSGGCAVPGVMAARTLRDPKERLATILVTPFMNCGAKLPVFAVLIAAFFSNRQGSMMFLLTLIAWTLALAAARILRWTVLRGDHSPFVMELPPYRLPTLKGLLIHTWERVWQYIKKAGTIILAISIVMWALMSYPEPPREAAVVFDHQAEALDAALAAGPAGSLLKDESARSDFVKRLEQLRSAEDPLKETASTDPRDRLAKAVVLASGEKPLPPDLLDLEPAARAYLGHAEERAVLDSARAAAGLRFSAAGRVGVALEAISRPLGFDWRTNIALAGGFAAKEVVIATLGTAYSLGDVTEGEGSTLAVKLASEPGWSPLQALTLMIFVMMYAPCLVTVVTIVREAGAKWAVFSVCYTTIAAYGLALIVRQVGLVLGF